MSTAAPPPPQADGNGGGDDEDDDADDDGGGKETPPPAGGTPKRKRKRTSSTLQECKWQEMFLRLVAFRQRTGHCLVPNRYLEDPSLGAWVATQRRNYRRMEAIDSTAAAGLTPQRIKHLEEIGFEWVTIDPRHVPWEARFQELKAFYDKYGHSEVPMRWEENVQLSNWVSKQRQDFKLRHLGKTSRLSDERMALLKGVGFAWNIPRKGRKIKRKEIPVVSRERRGGDGGDVDDDTDDEGEEVTDGDEEDVDQQQPARAAARARTTSETNRRVAAGPSSSGVAQFSGHSGRNGGESSPMAPVVGTGFGGVGASAVSSGGTSSLGAPATATSTATTTNICASGTTIGTSTSSGNTSQLNTAPPDPPDSSGNPPQPAAPVGQTVFDLSALLGLNNTVQVFSANNSNQQQQPAVPITANPGGAPMASGNGTWQVPPAAPAGAPPTAVLLPIQLGDLMAALQQQQQHFIPVVIPTGSLSTSPGLSFNMATQHASGPPTAVISSQQNQQNAVQQSAVHQQLLAFQQLLQQQVSNSQQQQVSFQQLQPSFAPQQLLQSFAPQQLQQPFQQLQQPFQQQVQQPAQQQPQQQPQQQQALQTVLIQLLSQYTTNNNNNSNSSATPDRR